MEEPSTQVVASRHFSALTQRPGLRRGDGGVESLLKPYPFAAISAASISFART